jgi:hypothetical protein
VQEEEWVTRANAPSDEMAIPEALKKAATVPTPSASPEKVPHPARTETLPRSVEGRRREATRQSDSCSEHCQSLQQTAQHSDMPMLSFARSCCSLLRPNSNPTQAANPTHIDRQRPSKFFRSRSALTTPSADRPGLEANFLRKSPQDPMTKTERRHPETQSTHECSSLSAVLSACHCFSFSQPLTDWLPTQKQQR